MDLRWGLLLVGLAVLTFVYVYSRYRPKIDERPRSSPGRNDPTFVGDEQSAPVDVPDPLTDQAKDISPSIGASPTAASAPDLDGTSVEADAIDESSVAEPVHQFDPGQANQIIAIRLMARSNGGFPADKLILALREAGLRHGQFGIFHRPDTDDERRADFSVANLIEPGSFDLTRVKKDYYPGVSIFLSLPGPENGVKAFDDMLTTSRLLADKLDGELRDEQGSKLSIQRERYMREEVVQFQHQLK